MKRQTKKQKAAAAAKMRAAAIGWLQREKLPHTSLQDLASAEHSSGSSMDGFDVSIGNFATSPEHPAKTITLISWRGETRQKFSFNLAELYAEALAGIKPWTKERRVYFFTCEQCGKGDRQTFKRSKAKNKLCRSCRKGPQIDPNQQALFPAPEK